MKQNEIYFHGRPFHNYPSYPLHWPDGWPRTERDQTTIGRFNTEFDVSREGIMGELTLMRAKGVVVSSNVPIKPDGSFDKEMWDKTFMGHIRNPIDTGVAVYFWYENAVRVFACDKWRSYFSNTQAIHKTIQAVRGVERWGTSEMLTRLYDSFTVISLDGKAASSPHN